MINIKEILSKHSLEHGEFINPTSGREIMTLGEIENALKEIIPLVLQEAVNNASLNHFCHWSGEGDDVEINEQSILNTIENINFD